VAPAAITITYSFTLVELEDFGRFNFFESVVAAGAKVSYTETPTPGAAVSIKEVD
jgi:hypothetical protein